MTDILKGLEDLNPTPTTDYARKVVAALKAAGISCLDIKDDGTRVIALADRGDDWHGWVGYTHDFLKTHDIDALVAGLWDWREADLSKITLSQG